jgi:hypothetical protein
MPRAIDFHVHPATEEAIIHQGKYLEAAVKYFGVKYKPVSIDETARLYMDNDIVAVLLAMDAESNMGTPKISNDFVAEACKKYPNVFIGFASVDPWKGTWGIKELERAINKLGLRGLKFAQQGQAFHPNDRKFYPLYEKCVELDIPVLFHMGTTGIGAGTPGGCGIRLKYTRPIELDDVAADFPELTIIGAHPAWPWQEEMLAITQHKGNVYIDLSGWSPKYFPKSLIHYANTMLQDKCLFGSDYPLIPLERWLKDFEEAPFKDGVREKILINNAKKILKL